jgi:hypothetical protein
MCIKEHRSLARTSRTTSPSDHLKQEIALKIVRKGKTKETESTGVVPGSVEADV